MIAPVRVRMALHADLGAMAEVLTRAFVDDPMMRWVTGVDDASERCRVSMPGFYVPVLDAAHRCGHTYVGVDDAGRAVGGALWAPPDQKIFDEASSAAFGAALFEHLGNDALQRLVAIGQLVGERHPHTPHFYLFVLGAGAPGHGIGGRLMEPVLARCDSDGLPAYLESSNPRNVAFYERQGFEVQWEARPGDDGPLLQGMWREPVGG